MASVVDRPHNVNIYTDQHHPEIVIYKPKALDGEFIERLCDLFKNYPGRKRMIDDFRIAIPREDKRAFSTYLTLALNKTADGPNYVNQGISLVHAELREKLANSFKESTVIVNERALVVALRELVAVQGQAMREVHGDWSVTKDIVRQYVFAMGKEAGELADELGWKDWKLPKPLNLDRLLDEWADNLAFFGALTAIVVKATGASPELLASAYANKVAVNFRRFAGKVDGYGIVKDTPVGLEVGEFYDITLLPNKGAYPCCRFTGNEKQLSIFETADGSFGLLTSEQGGSWFAKVSEFGGE